MARYKFYIVLYCIVLLRGDRFRQEHQNAEGVEGRDIPPQIFLETSLETLHFAAFSRPLNILLIYTVFQKKHPLILLAIS